jgi:hypothetical protein
MDLGCFKNWRDAVQRGDDPVTATKQLVDVWKSQTDKAGSPPVDDLSARLDAGAAKILAGGSQEKGEVDGDVGVLLALVGLIPNPEDTGLNALRSQMGAREDLVFALRYAGYAEQVSDWTDPTD